MDRYSNLERLKEYIEKTKEILELSSPQLAGIEGAEDYRVHLQESFRKIGELSWENNQILDTCFYPLINEEENPSEEEISVLREFGSMLLDTTSMENLDQPLIYLQAKYILEQAEKSGDIRALVLALDGMIIATYMMLNITIRLYPNLDVCFKYRDEGMTAARRLLEFLTPEKFYALPDDECRELVLINSRYMRCLFEWDDKEDREAVNREDLRLMKQALELAEDPFYLEAMPNYRWDAHVFRTLQYLADFTEYNNIHGFSKAQLEEIYGYTEKLVSFLAKHPELEEGCPEPEQRLYLLRNGFLAGKISAEEHRAGIIEIMKERDENDFSARGMFVSFIAPLEFVLTRDRENLSEEDEAIIRDIYSGIAGYAYRMPKTGVLSFMLTFISELLKNYIEVEGGLTFQEMCLKLLAAMHPPTYVHTLSVAEITRFLTDQLIDKNPESLVGIEGCETAKEVQERRNRILDFAYNGALMHDVGKLLIVETIMTYGRSLVESEWDIIRVHTEAGAALLEGFHETEKYRDMALGHHKWYDNKKGYPATFDLNSSGIRLLVGVLQVADCLDASTDTIGRSYKKGKSFKGFREELREGRSRRYDPRVVELLENDESFYELQSMVKAWRNKNYRETYWVLKSL